MIWYLRPFYNGAFSVVKAWFWRPVFFARDSSTVASKNSCCHFKIWLDCHKLKKKSCLIMPMSTKCQKIEEKMTINVTQHRLWYLRTFQRMILTTSFFLLTTVHITCIYLPQIYYLFLHGTFFRVKSSIIFFIINQNCVCWKIIFSNIFKHANFQMVLNH
jgi:hypothetical protein